MESTSGPDVISIMPLRNARVYGYLSRTSHAARHMGSQKPGM